MYKCKTGNLQLKYLQHTFPKFHGRIFLCFSSLGEKKASASSYHAETAQGHLQLRNQMQPQ